jgi:spermidine synthase
LRNWAVGTVLIGGLLIIFGRPLVNHVVEAMLYKSSAGSSPPLVAVIENRGGIIAVSDDGTVYGGGMYDGRFNIDPINDTNGIIRAYGLSLYHAAPRDVLMIGLASGSWAQVIANNPEVEHLTIVEINPGYGKLIRTTPLVASVVQNPKVDIVIDDGRRWLRFHPERQFDAIVANTVFHFRSNASNLLSSEFNELIRRHLNPGGIYLYNTTDSLRAQRTGCSSFRYGYGVFNNVLVSDMPIAFDVNHWRDILITYQIDGKPVFQRSRPTDADALKRITALFDRARNESLPPTERSVETCASILSRSVGVRTITDDNMGTEWRHLLGLD